MLHVSFLNKNTFRNYPLRGSGGVVSTDGLVVPTSLLSAAQFSVPTSYHMVYASRIYILDNHVNMLIASWVGSAPVYLEAAASIQVSLGTSFTIGSQTVNPAGVNHVVARWYRKLSSRKKRSGDNKTVSANHASTSS